MKLSQALEAAEYRITEGSTYLWKCFGPTARYIDVESKYGNGSIVFDTQDNRVYEITICDSEVEPVAYRWRDPAFAAAQEQEAAKRGIDNSIAWDEVQWIDTDLEEDFFEKMTAILNGEEFDTRIAMAIDMTDAEFNVIARAAHELDITVNEFVVMALEEAIYEMEANIDTPHCKGCNGNCGCLDDDEFYPTC